MHAPLAIALSASLLLVPGLGPRLAPSRTPAPRAAATIGKGMNRVALVELGSGCCHGNNSTKAAIRACNNAIEWNSVKVRTIIPGSYEAMQIHVQIAVPSPETLDLDLLAACFPYGSVLIMAEEGGLLGSSRSGLPADEPVEGLMTVACACVTVGWQADEEEAAAPRPATVASAPEPPPRPPSTIAPDVVPPLQQARPDIFDILARAAASKARWADRVLTPYEAFALMGDSDDVEVWDVRTTAQRTGHAINGRVGLTVMGAKSVSIDDIVSGAADPPPADLPVLLVCSKGPKSAVALDYLAGVCEVYCVDGGVTAWDQAKLPTEECASDDA